MHHMFILGFLISLAIVTLTGFAIWHLKNCDQGGVTPAPASYDNGCFIGKALLIAVIGLSVLFMLFLIISLSMCKKNYQSNSLSKYPDWLDYDRLIL